jgi:hypothetical protein
LYEPYGIQYAYIYTYIHTYIHTYADQDFPVLAVPLRVEERLAGVLIVAIRDSGEFTFEDESNMTDLAVIFGATLAASGMIFCFVLFDLLLA